MLRDYVVINGRKLTVTDIAQYSFARLGSIKEVVIPNTVITIQWCVFWCCYALNSVIFIPGSRVRSIQSKFLDNTVVSRLTLPATISYLNNEFIYNLRNDFELTYCGTNVIKNAIFGGSRSNIKIYVHDGYNSSSFGGVNVTVSNDIVCPTVVYQNKYTNHCSRPYKNRASMISHTLIYLLYIS